MSSSRSEIDILKRKLAREKKARKDAEQLLEEKSLELFQANDKLVSMNQSLEHAVKERTSQLRSSESKFKSIVENANDLIFRANANGQITYVNPVAISKMGYDRAELEGRQLKEFIHSDYEHVLLELQQYQYEKNINASYVEIPVISKNGQILWLGQNVQFIFEEKKLTEILIFAKDLSEQRVVKDELLNTTSRLKALITGLHSGILVEDENRKIVVTNHQFCQIFNIPLEPQVMIGVDCSNSAEQVKDMFVEPDQFLNDINIILREKKMVVNELLEMVDGRIFERDYIPIFSDEAYKGHLWQYRDVTVQKMAERKIRQSEEKYRGIMENMDLGLMEVDQEGNISKVYKRFCEMVGYTEDELLGKNADAILLPSEYTTEMDAQNSQRKEGKSNVYEVEILKKNGERMWVLIGGAPFYNEFGYFCGSIGVHYDISDRKKLEHDLIKAKKIAEQAREAEKQFLANMSHEIRNPINAIIGVTNLLFDTNPNEDQLDYLQTIKYSSDILLDLISGILDLSKIESGKLDIENKPVCLPEVLEAVIQTYRFKSGSKHIEYKACIDDQVPKYLMADRTVLNQVFLNLIGNATKFTEEGAIGVNVSLLGENDAQLHLEFEVWDTGIGIPEDKIDLIFQSFKQASNETQIKYGGTGLGLSIVKQLVNHYQGNIAVSSQENEGACFRFDMYFEKVKQPVTDPQPKLNKAEHINLSKVLIVEDNVLNQTYLSGLLKKWNIDFHIANNGIAALKLIEQYQYDLILMDIRMPQMDGYETTINIRSASNNPNQHVPIVALTASALVDEKDKALAAGMNYHLPKPFTPELLMDALQMFSIDSTDFSSLPETEVNTMTNFTFIKDLDYKHLNEYYQDDLEQAGMMFDIFLMTIDEELAELHNQFTAENWSSFAKTAHRIKPNFGMVGLTEYELLMKFFELEAVEGKNFDLLKLKYHEFVEERDQRINFVRVQNEELQKIL